MPVLKRLMRRAETGLISSLATAVALLGLSAGSARAQDIGQIQFLFTGDEQSFVVPPDVTELFVLAFGAGGASSGEGIGGGGGLVTGNLTVTPGEVLLVYVGGQGCDQTAAVLGCGGFNGGGDGRGTGGSTPSAGRGGGGGATDVRRAPGTLGDRLFVAAGGGGHCSAASIFPGGAGGGLEGGVGGTAQPGGGGTQTAGGVGFSNCSPGSLGLGGNSNPANTCAGGGGGWYGGGSGCGGGGGSSFLGALTNASTGAGGNPQDGLVSFQWVADQSPGIEIDVKPGAPNDVINVGTADKIEVALLGSDTFDVLDIDQTTLAFGPGGAAPFLWAGVTVEDIDSDDFDDLVVFFRLEESGILAGDTQACVTGELLNATPFQGCDTITALACGLGFELAFLLPPLAWLRGRRRRF